MAPIYKRKTSFGGIPVEPEQEYTQPTAPAKPPAKRALTVMARSPLAHVNEPAQAAVAVIDAQTPEPTTTEVNAVIKQLEPTPAAPTENLGAVQSPTLQRAATNRPLYCSKHSRPGRFMLLTRCGCEPAFAEPVRRSLERPAAEPPKPESSSVAQAQAVVSDLLEVVSAADSNQVKQALHEMLNPPAPVKRRPGRPRKWVSDAERKRAERLEANKKLAALLRHFELDLDSKIPPGLKTKYGIEVDSFRELLKDPKVQAEVIKEITYELEMIGAVPTPVPTNKETGLPLVSRGKYMRGAPSGKGELVYSAVPGLIHDIRLQREAGLSKPDSKREENLNFILPGDEELPLGDRRKVRPEGHGPDVFDKE